MTAAELVGTILGGGTFSTLATLGLNAWKTARAIKRAEAGLPLTDRELAQLPELPRLRYQVDQLSRKVEELYVQLGTLRSEGARSAAEAAAAKLLVEGITRERDSLAAQLEETTTERDGARAEVDQVRSTLHATQLQLEQAEQRLSAVGRSDQTGRHRPPGGR